MNFLTNINLGRNELQNAVIHPLAAPPANPKEGQIYYNSTDKFIYRYDGSTWGPIGVVYNQGSTTGAVITGLDSAGNVTTTNVVGLTLTGYTPVADGYVTNGMTMQQALAALDEAVKNAVAGGGEVNQNAWSKITVKKQSDAATAVTGASADTTLSADAKVDTFNVASGNKWVDINGSGKTVTIGHSLSSVTAGTTGSANTVPAITVDAAGHITGVSGKTITPDAIGADVAGAAQDVLGSSSDTSDKATVYGARALANTKVASVGATANKGIEIAGTATEPTVGIKLSTASGNAASLSADGLMVTIPEVTVPEYTITKLSTATSGYLASYQLQKDNVGIGDVINIPKDYLVKSAEVKTSTGADDASGFPAGTKYIDFTVNTYDTASGSGTTSHIYLNVEDLVDVYTPGNGIDISDANVISAKVVAGNGLSIDGSGIKMSLASETAAGAMSADDKAKLDKISDEATKNTITLNGTANANLSFYAPTTSGSSGQVLVSNGANSAPTWQTAVKKYTATNDAITASGDAFTWNIPATTHGISNNAIIVQVYEVATNSMVVTDVTVNATNYNVSIVINDADGAGTLTAGKYRAVVLG